MRLHFRSDLVGACPPQTLLRTDEEELCQFDTIPPTIEKTERSRLLGIRKTVFEK